VACFVFWREICHPTFSDFCNKICHERCGLRAGEVVRLKVKHIDSAQKITRVEQSKGRKEALDLLRQWWRVRPSRYDSGKPQEGTLAIP
jgi:integrase